MIFMMRTTLLFLFGLAWGFSVAAQEPSEKPEALNLQVEGPSAATNQLTVKTGIQDETQPAPTLSLKEKQQDEAQVPQNGLEAASTNATTVAKLSFLLNTGIQYAEEGEYKDAERAYLRALETDPDNPVIRFRLSTLYLLTDRYVEAVEILEALAAEFPDNSRARNNLAWAYATGEGVRNKKKALLHAREAILSAPISPSMWNTLAEAYYMGGDYERALRASEHAIDLLTQRNPESDELPSFEAQRTKIQRAAKALRMLDGLDEEE